MSQQGDFTKGRGAQINTPVRFLQHHFSRDEIQGIDDWEVGPLKTQFFLETAHKVVNKVDSPDIPFEYSLNPYQGCEHGCIYCYARNTHEYWGLSAGQDFERKIIVKENAVDILKKTFMKPSWQGAPISLSGNTDCYQPAERKLKITRSILELCLDCRNPVGIITKNQLVLRDLDLLQEMAKLNLVKVFISITSDDEDLRLLLEPRTASYQSRFKTLETLSKNGIFTGVMNAPIIPGLNDQDTPAVLKKAADAGAKAAGYTMVRLNGAVGPLFKDWLQKTFPDKLDKVWHLISELHGGQVSDSRFGTRMKGEGQFAYLFAQHFKILCKKYGLNKDSLVLDRTLFRRPEQGGQLSLF